MQVRYAGAGASAVILATAGVLVSCAGSSSGHAGTASPASGATAQCDLNNPTCLSSGQNPPAAAVAKDHVLHNVHRIGSKMISGRAPEGDPAFDELKLMGVRTIISVDGATPEVEKAAVRGMRYVHIPITYAEATHEQLLELARAVRDLPGPIYIHCHHGKHRSPAAAAAVAVALGEATPEEGVAFMKTAGTAPNYTGLYACVANAVVVSAMALDGAPNEFPSIRRPTGITGAMVDIDEAYDHLGAIRAAGWATPKDQPDLVPAAEAGRMADHFRYGSEDPRAKALGDDFNRRLTAAIEGATALEDRLATNAPKDALESSWKIVVSSCKDCHAQYRDVKR